MKSGLGSWEDGVQAKQRAERRMQDAKMQDAGREWALQQWVQGCLSGLADCESQPWRRDLKQAESSGDFNKTQVCPSLH